MSGSLRPCLKKLSIGCLSCMALPFSSFTCCCSAFRPPWHFSIFVQHLLQFFAGLMEICLGCTNTYSQYFRNFMVVIPIDGVEIKYDPVGGSQFPDQTQ